LDKTRHKFTSFIRSAVVEIDQRSAPTYPEGNTIEWVPQPNQPPMDGFEVLRRGDVNVDCRILLHVAHQPERFKVLPPLNDLIGVQEGTRSDVMSALWKLIKVAGAQDKEDATVIRPVGGLEKVGEVSMAFADRRSCPKVYSFINFPSWRPAS
jgi:SWI/SNF-related matrix-associated actin-dependent regulator of chromatin subfamily D